MKKFFRSLLLLVSALCLIGGLLLTGYTIGQKNIANSLKKNKTVNTKKDIKPKDAKVNDDEASSDEANSDESEDEFSDEAIETSADDFSSAESSEYDNWSKDSIYNGGETIAYKGILYKASWWTQGDIPDKSGEWGVWKVVGSAPTKKDSKDKKKDDTSDDTANAIPISTKKGSKNFKIVGYYPDWSPAKADSIQYNNLTHINYAFAVPNSDSTLKPFENPDLAKKIIKKAHKNKVKVLIAVGGWSYNDNPLEPVFVSATSSDAKCQKLANNILKLVDQYGFDGVDMDWEHPRVDGNSKKQYESLMKYLRKGLNTRKKLLTSAVLAGVSADGNILWDSAAHTDTVIKYVDWLNVMAYDGGDGDRHSPYKFGVNSANYWLKTRKVPKHKVVLGVPFYARPSWASYDDILKADSSASSKDVTTYNGMSAYYNGLSTIKKKTNWSLKNAGGIMIWELSQDTSNPKKSLLTQIRKTVTSYKK